MNEPHEGEVLAVGRNLRVIAAQILPAPRCRERRWAGLQRWKGQRVQVREGLAVPAVEWEQIPLLELGPRGRREAAHALVRVGAERRPPFLPGGSVVA
jgi:hypothetical protein